MTRPKYTEVQECQLIGAVSVSKELRLSMSEKVTNIQGNKDKGS